ncbi:MAG: PASTA domain-containing protein [Chlorobi bacterium]|nr:PASTA domain-containing protein [Chlorobiota bacterium]
MKKITKKIVFIPLAVIFIIIAFVILMNSVILPWYVEAPEFRVPNLIGKSKTEAVKILVSLKLNPIIEGPKYDENVPKDHVIYCRPHANTLVKEGRRIYLYISGGEPLVKMPTLVGKTLRDAKITVERNGLIIGEIEKVRSEFAAGTVIEQTPEANENIAKGSVVDMKVSVGPKIGMIRVPNLIGKSLRKGERLLRNNSLFIRKVNYQISPNLLPNTIFDQLPSEGRLVNVGDSIDVWVTKSKVE